MTRAVTAPDPRDERSRRNVRLAWAHAVLALGFLVAFIWVQIHR